MNTLKHPAYVETRRYLREDKYISKRQMLSVLERDMIWFDTDHAENDITQALNDYRNNN